MSDAAPVGALQRRLALEQEAVWLTGLVAARFEELADAAETSLEAHRLDRDDLIVRIAAARATPQGAQAAYGVPPDSVESARAALADLEGRLAAAALPLVSVGDPSERREALRALRRAAAEQIAWGAAPEAFPGLAGQTPSS